MHEMCGKFPGRIDGKRDELEYGGSNACSLPPYRMPKCVVLASQYVQNCTRFFF